MTTYVKPNEIIKPSLIVEEDFSLNYNEQKLEEFIHKLVKSKIVKERIKPKVILWDKKSKNNEEDDDTPQEQITLQEIINFMNNDVSLEKYDYILFEKFKNYFRQHPSLEYHRFGERHQDLIKRLNLDIYMNSKVLKACSCQGYSELIKELFLYVFNDFLQNPEKPNMTQRFINFVIGFNENISQSQITILGNTLGCAKEKTAMDENVFFEYYLNLYKRMNPSFQTNYVEIESTDSSIDGQRYTFSQNNKKDKLKKQREERGDIEDSDFWDVIHI